MILTLRRGMVPDIYNSLAEKINFTYTLRKSRDGSWGSVDQVSGRFGNFNDLYSLSIIYQIYSRTFTLMWGFEIFEKAIFKTNLIKQTKIISNKL